MLYYKFRSATELSFKELLYSELRFSSSAECNDPFDSKVFTEFPKDIHRWSEVVTKAWAHIDYPALVSLFSTQIALYNHLSFDHFNSTDFACEVIDELNLNIPERTRLQLAERLCIYVSNFRPRKSYFSSFALESDAALMWSHYADRHQGFCLIFRALNNRLYQDPARRKNVIRIRNGHLPDSTLHVADSFEFGLVKYVDQVIPHNAFNYFPSPSIQLNEEQRLAALNDMQRNYFEKHVSWSYEKEARLSLLGASPILSNTAAELAADSRLFNYDPRQLVGIIFGANCSPSTRDRLTDICLSRFQLAHLSNFDGTLFDFAFFEAKFAPHSRKLTIQPKFMLTHEDCYQLKAPHISDSFSNWLDGRGITRAGNTSTLVFLEPGKSQNISWS